MHSKVSVTSEQGQHVRTFSLVPYAVVTKRGCRRLFLHSSSSVSGMFSLVISLKQLRADYTMFDAGLCVAPQKEALAHVQQQLSV